MMGETDKTEGRRYMQVDSLKYRTLASPGIVFHNIA